MKPLSGLFSRHPANLAAVALLMGGGALLFAQSVTLILPADFYGTVTHQADSSGQWETVTNAPELTITLSATNGCELFTGQRDQVRLAWSGVEGATGYAIHYGDIAGTVTNHLYVGNVTNCFINGMSSGSNFWFAATTLAPDGESDYSVPCSWTNVPLVLKIRAGN